MDFKRVIELVKSTREIVFNEQKLNEITAKGYADFVTGIDLAVQSYLSKELLKIYPDVQFMGEEGEKKELDFSGKIWILDPIDGTANLIHRLSLSAVSLALCDNDEIAFGVVYNPFNGDIFYAEKGKGAYFNGEKIHVTSNKFMRDCFVSVGTSPYDDELRRRSVKVIGELLESCQDVRRLGAASIDLCYVACGKFDCFYEEILRPWDFAAGELIITEAGGKITDLGGNKLSHKAACGIVASNTYVHDEFVNIVNLQGEKTCLTEKTKP